MPHLEHGQQAEAGVHGRVAQLADVVAEEGAPALHGEPHAAIGAPVLRVHCKLHNAAWKWSIVHSLTSATNLLIAHSPFHAPNLRRTSTVKLSLSRNTLDISDKSLPYVLFLIFTS